MDEDWSSLPTEEICSGGLRERLERSALEDLMDICVRAACRTSATFLSAEGTQHAGAQVSPEIVYRREFTRR